MSLALAAPTAAQTQFCSASQKNAAIAELMFGRKIGDRVAVTDRAWQHFLDHEVTPRFPDGLTVVDAAGQWRDPVRKRVIREPSKIVTIVLKDTGADQMKLDAIAAAYKAQFKQQSVAIAIRPACVSF